MAVTLKDIAQALGVSVVTVSKVMREHSSKDHQSGQIGVRAANMLVRLLNDKTTRRVRQVMLKPSLVIRESSLRPTPTL